MPRAALAFSCVLIVAGALLLFMPTLTEEREVPVSTAGTPSLFVIPTLIEVRAGQRACVTDVTLDPEADIVRFRVGTYRAEGEPLELVLSGAGYRERVDVPGGYVDNATISRRINGPARELIGSVCIENEGRRRMGLYGTSEVRTRSRTDVTVDGEPLEVDMALAFFERERQSMLERTGEILDAMTAFRPIGGWLTWPLLFLVLIGMPALALWALDRAFRDQPSAATSRSTSEIKRR